MNATFVMIKPDGVKRGLIGEIIKRFEQKGFIIRGMRLEVLPAARARIHYEEHKGREFFERMVSSICSGPAVLLWLELPEDVEVPAKAWEMARYVGGDTWGHTPGSIRGDFAYGVPQNVIHTAVSAEDAEWELNLHFNRESRDQVPATERSIDK